MAKEHSNSVLGNLPLHQQEQLIAWLIEDRISVQAAVDKVWQDFGVRTSDTAMYRFYRRHCTPRLLRYARQESDALPEASGGLTENWDKSSEELLQQKFFELLANPESVDPKQLIAYGQIVRQGQMIALKKRELTSKEDGFRLKYEQREREIGQREKQIILDREKFETSAAELAMKHAKEIKAIAADRSLNADAKVEHVRQRLFGSGPKITTEVAS